MTATGWIGVLGTWLAIVLPPSSFAALIVSLIRRHEFRFDTRMRRSSRHVRYSFVIANAREEPVRGPVTLVFEPLLRSGMFLEPPTVLCGPKAHGFMARYEDEEAVPTNSGAGLSEGVHDARPAAPTSELASARRGHRYIVRVPSFRALATWVILCRTNGCDGDTLMHLYVGHKRERTVRGSIRPPRAAWRGWWLWLAVTVLTLASYGGQLVLDTAESQENSWQAIDGWILAGLVLCSVVSFLLMWERRRRPVFGYVGWDVVEMPYR
jgi:hypothetical protein